MEKLVSVIIANHRFDQLFKDTVISVLSNVKVRNLNIELIVVSNGMEAEKAERVREWLKNKPVRLMQIQEGNPSKARNLGAMASKSKYLVFLDNDTRVEKGWLGEVVKYLDKHSKVGAGQLKLLRIKTHMLVTNQHVFDSAGEMLTKSGFLVERAREAKDKGQFDYDDFIFSGKGAGMVVRRDVFEKVGGFDESYVYYWEEPDLFWRVWKAKYEVRFLWMGVVFHAYGTKLKPIPKVPVADQVYLACRNQVMTILKNATGRYRKRMLVGVGLSWLGLECLFLLRGKLKQAWAIKRAWWWLLRHRVKSDKRSDDEWIEKVLAERGFKWYLGKAKAYLSGRPF